MRAMPNQPLAPFANGLADRRCRDNGCRHAAGGAADPITIGFSMSQSGPLAVNGKSALLAMQIWQDDVNAKGGLLGRPVKLVYYDDQSNPSTVPGIYTKLLDVDKVDLVVSGYATNIDRAGHAGRNAARQGLHRPVRARRQQHVPLSALLVDDTERPRCQSDHQLRLFRRGHGAKSQAADRSPSSAPTPSFPRTPWKARGPTPRPPD